jgi:hypothetical protein
MKKILLGTLAVIVLAFATVVIVKAVSSTDENKKAKTEVVKEGTKCGSAHECNHEKGDKTACDPAKCAGKCDHDKKESDPAKCKSDCTKEKTEKKCEKKCGDKK